MKGFFKRNWKNIAFGVAIAGALVVSGALCFQVASLAAEVASLSATIGAMSSQPATYALIGELTLDSLVSVV